MASVGRQTACLHSFVPSNTGFDSGSGVDAIAGAVFYTDGTYHEQDKEASKRALANRQGALRQMKEEDDLIRDALAGPTNEDPVAALLTELNKRRVKTMGKHGFFFSHDNSQLQSMQRPQAYDCGLQHFAAL
jgi:hypothetical protein